MKIDINFDIFRMLSLLLFVPEEAVFEAQFGHSIFRG